MKRKMAKILVPLIVILVISAVGVAYYSGFRFPQDITQKCILTTDYRYLGCSEDTLNPTPVILRNTPQWTCPSTATRCVVTSVYPTNLCGMNPCKIRTCTDPADCGTAWFPSFGPEYMINQNIPTGTTIYSKDYVDIFINQFETVLADCGYGSCPAQVSPFIVSGSDHCSFNIDKTIYDSSGQIVAKNTQGAFAYTVPRGRTYAFPERPSYCLYVPSCNSNSDCVQYGQYQGTYNGQTVGYGFTGLNLAVYGCRMQTIPQQIDRLGDSSKNLSVAGQQQAGTCGVIFTKAVQCQPATSSCGPNAFCKDMGNLDFQCQVTAQCSADWECGQSQQCDVSTRQLKVPKCVGGQCTFSSTAVECCDNLNCPNNWVCGSDNKCKQGGGTIQPCPFECCINNPAYIYKSCAPTETCCPNGACEISCSGGNCSKENQACGLFQPACCSGLTCQGGLFGIGSTCMKNTVPEIPWTLIIIIGAGAGIVTAVALAYRYTKKR